VSVPMDPAADTAALAGLHDEIVACRACPRLVAWREQVAAERRAAFAAQTYWGRPVPGFGDPDARVLVVGLAPAAHGGNRTGRIFTGDRSGDWLFRSLHATGFANQPTSVALDDGLVLRGMWITAPVRCAPPANKPTTLERDTCRPFLEREVAALTGVRVIVALGAFAYQSAATLVGLRPRPRFGHGVEVDLGGAHPVGVRAGAGPAIERIVCSYHVSQQNTFTGRLTEAMLDEVFRRARQLAGLPDGPGPGS
jgi:uracil-DNA glycosylase